MLVKKLSGGQNSKTLICSIDWLLVLKIKKKKKIFFFWPCYTPCGILAPPPETKLEPPALEVRTPNHWITREVPALAGDTGVLKTCSQHGQVMLSVWFAECVARSRSTLWAPLWVCWDNVPRRVPRSPFSCFLSTFLVWNKKGEKWCCRGGTGSTPFSLPPSPWPDSLPTETSALSRGLGLGGRKQGFLPVLVGLPVVRLMETDICLPKKRGLEAVIGSSTSKGDLVQLVLRWQPWAPTSYNFINFLFSFISARQGYNN